MPAEKAPLTAAEGCIDLEIQDNVATITIDRPTARNAMTRQMWDELYETARALTAKPQLRVVILHGRGETFCSGQDIPEIHRLTLPEVEDSFKAMEAAIGQIEAIPVPVLGILRGVAAGAGCELLLACDLRIAARSARIGMPIARLGITIGTNFGQRLVNLVGPSRARELLFTARLIRGTEAYRWGMVNYAVPDKEVETRCHNLARRIAALSPASLRAGKRATGVAPPFPDEEAATHRYAGDGEEFREGVTAWMERRDPIF